jgi:protein TonB
MSDRFIEKSFLYLLAVSLLVHAAAFTLIYFMPPPKRPAETEPLMVDLQEMPLLPEPVPRTAPPVPRKADRRQRVARETAPRGESPREKPAPLPSPTAPRAQAQQREEPRPDPGPARPVPPTSESGRSGLLVRPKPASPPSPDLAQLFPSASRMARLEESYRKKYSSEVKEGETRFLNTDDILFGSFLRRFETSVYGVWRYPAEAARQGIEGVTPVRITFNRRGEIERVTLLESSGSRVLDDEVIRALKLVGPIGSLPKGYDKDQFNLIAFFQYGLTRGGRSIR